MDGDLMLRGRGTGVNLDIASGKVTGKALLVQNPQRKRSSFEQRFRRDGDFVTAPARIGHDHLALTNRHDR